jgi:hypothetical protein
MSDVLARLAEELAAGRIRVVDLTQPLGPETPVIGLPPMFAPSPGVSIDVISRYDEKGPGWYWNIMRLGEHTGRSPSRPAGRDSPSRTPVPPAGPASSGSGARRLSRSR